MASIRTKRLMSELKDLENCKPISDDHLDILEAKLMGEPGTPYENGCFILRIELPERYPFEPPRVRFMTKIYHPNIDKEGRICLEILKPASTTNPWKATYNISTVLGALKVLMAEPNPDDPLEQDIAEEMLVDKERYLATARLWTEKYASGTIENANEGDEVSGKDVPVQNSTTLAQSSTVASSSSNAGSIASKTSSSCRMRTLFSSKAKSEHALKMEEPMEVAESPSTNDTSSDESLKRSTSDVSLATPKRSPWTSTSRIRQPARSPIAASTPTKGQQPMSQNSSSNKSSTSLNVSSKSKNEKTPKDNNSKKKGAGDGKRENAVPSQQKKRPRFEDLYLDEDDDVMVL